MYSDPYQQLFEGRQEQAPRPVGSGWLSRRSTRTKVLMLLGVLVLLGTLVFVIAWEVHVSSPFYKYEHIKIGMTYEEVVDMMGGPGKIEDSESSGDQEVRVWHTGRYDMIFISVAFRDGCVTYKGIINWEI